MQNAPGDYSVNFPTAYYKIGTFSKWNKIEKGGSYAGGPSYIYIYIYMFIYVYQLIPQTALALVKQHWQPLQVFALSQSLVISLFRLLLQPILT